MNKIPLIAAGSAAVGLIGVLTWTLWPAGPATAGTGGAGGSVDDVLAWPAVAAELTLPELTFAEGMPTKRIYLDAGHGAKDNRGNEGAWGQLEQDFTLSLATDVERILLATGHFEVRVCRKSDELVAYADRVQEAETWPADVFVSLHSDVRQPEGVGYSVLWSDEGPPELVAARVALARSMAAQLAALTLPAYQGLEYAGLYEGDRVPGVFVDRHDAGKRIFVLRKPSMPSIIVETHNAKSPQEAKRWNEPAVRRAFAHALALTVAKL